MILLNQVEGMSCGYQNPEMHFGDWLKTQRKGKRWSLAKAALALEMSSDALHKIEKGKTRTPQPSTLERVVGVFGEIPAELDPAVSIPAPNILPGTERQQPSDELEVTLAVAACHWVELAEEAGFFGMRRPAHGRFSIVISGDCMAPRWMDGERVTFEMMDGGESDFVVDEDYLVIRDGEATFKRCAKVGEDEIVLDTRNPKYKKSWKVPRGLIQRAAVACFAHVIRPK